MTYHDFQDDDLIDLLFTEYDRLPRSAVEEFVKRGDRMITPLSDIVRYNYYWNGDDENWWAVINATYILGAISRLFQLKRLKQSGTVWNLSYDDNRH